MTKYPEPTVGALIVNAKGEILLAESPKWKGGYTIPGGHIELGETIEHAVKREVKEEVGINVELKKVLFVQEAIFSKRFYKKKHFIFLECVCEAKTNNIKLDNREMTSFFWITPEKALKLKLEGFTRNFIVEYLKYIKA